MRRRRTRPPRAGHARVVAARAPAQPTRRPAHHPVTTGGVRVDSRARQHVARLLGLRPQQQVPKLGERDAFLFEELRDVAQGGDRGFQLDVLGVGERRLSGAVDEAFKIINPQIDPGDPRRHLSAR